MNLKRCFNILTWPILELPRFCLKRLPPGLMFPGALGLRIAQQLLLQQLPQRVGHCCLEGSAHLVLTPGRPQTFEAATEVGRTPHALIQKHLVSVVLPNQPPQLGAGKQLATADTAT